MESFSSKPGRKQGYSLLSLLFSVVLEVLIIPIKQKKKKKKDKTGREEIKSSSFIDNTVLYVESPKDSTKPNVRINK